MGSLCRVRPSVGRSVRPSVRLHYRVRSINPIPIERFSSNLDEMFTSTRSRSQLKVTSQTIKYQTLCRVRSVCYTLIKYFSSNLAEMFTSTRGCAEPMLPCQLTVKVTIEGQFAYHQLLDIKPCPLCKSYTNSRVFFNLGSNVHLKKRECAEPCYPFAGLSHT